MRSELYNIIDASVSGSMRTGSITPSTHTPRTTYCRRRRCQCRQEFDENGEERFSLQLFDGGYRVKAVNWAGRVFDTMETGGTNSTSFIRHGYCIQSIEHTTMDTPWRGEYHAACATSGPMLTTEAP